MSDSVSSRRSDGRLFDRLRERLAARDGARRRRRPRVRRAAARGGVRARRIRHDRDRPRPAEGRRGHPGRRRTSPTWRPRRSPGSSTIAGCARRPTSRSSPGSTRSTSACRRRCARRRTPTCRTSCRRSSEIAEHLHPGMLVILESTTYPGTTEELVQPMLEASGLRAGVDFFLAFSPERVDPGNPTFNTHNVPKVVGGVGPESTELAVDALRRRDRDDRAGQLAAGRRDGEAAREHVPRR